MLDEMVHPALLEGAFDVWAIACVGGAVWLRRAPAVALALIGSVLGGVAGSLLGNADGPAEAPAYAASGATIGAFAIGIAAALVTRARPPSAALRRAAGIVAVVVPLATFALIRLIQIACPLYVRGRASGYCDYGEQDLLGGWASGVVAVFALDAVLIVGLLLLALRQAVRAEDAEDDWFERRAAARAASVPRA
jgi:hypothetical protein